MADITKCSGGGCVMADKCRRYTAKPYEYKYYFTTPPFIIDNGKFTCEMFWGRDADYLLADLKRIMSSKPTEKRD